MVKRDEYKMAGMKLTVFGLIIMAFDLCALQVERIFGVWNLLEFASILGMLVAWILVFLGVNSISRYAVEYKGIKRIAAIMIIVAVIEGLIAFKNVRNGMLEQSFIDVTVMFLSYILIVGMLYAYYKLLRGTGSLTKKYRSTSISKQCNQIAVPSIIIVMFILVIVPVCGMFTKIIEYVGVGVLCAVMFFVEMNMCRLLLSGAKKLSGRGAKVESDE